MSKKILRVDSGELRIIRSDHATLTIVVRGVVGAPGYKNGRLIPHVYVTFPADGIYDFDFVADLPNVACDEVFLPIFGTYIWCDVPKELKGIRVHTFLNNKEWSLDSATELKLEPMPLVPSDKVQGQVTGDRTEQGHSQSKSPESGKDESVPAMECSDCKGTGRVLLLTSQRPCEKCHGTGKLPGLKEGEETVQAADLKPEGEPSRQMLIVITRTEFTEDEDGNIVDVKEISREEKLVPFSDADGQIDWPPNSIMHESWPGGEIAYYEYDSTEENGTPSDTSHDVAIDDPTTSSAICPECKGNCFFTALGTTKRCKRCRGTGFCDIEP